MLTDAKLPGFEEKFREVKGVRMRYFVGGAGDATPIVLVHGFGGSASNWVELAAALARSRRVLVPDLPGHGGSSALPATPSLAPYADRVALVAEHEGFLPAAFAGHSLGAVVAVRIAERRPDDVTALVLAAAAGISSGTQRAKWILTVVALMRPGRLIAPFASTFARSPLLRRLSFDSWATADATALTPLAAEGFLASPRLHTDVLGAAEALAAEDPRQDLERVRCPSLVIWGADDPQVPLEDAFDYARRLRAPLRVIAGCGHLVIGERPDACLDAIESFLAR